MSYSTESKNLKNSMRPVDRVAAIEALQAFERQADYNLHRVRCDAWGRLLRALVAVLPAWADVSHGAVLGGIVTRLQGNESTGADLAIVQSLPAEDLAIAGLTAGEFLATLKATLDRY